MFGVPKYAASLTKVAWDKDIAVNYKLELIEITPQRAIFLDANEQVSSVVTENTNIPSKLKKLATQLSSPINKKLEEIERKKKKPRKP